MRRNVSHGILQSFLVFSSFQVSTDVFAESNEASGAVQLLDTVDREHFNDTGVPKYRNSGTFLLPLFAACNLPY